MTGGLNFKTFMTLRMPEVGKAGFGLKKLRLSCDMESLMKIPDDMFNQEIAQYLTLDNIVKLDKACMNHEYRHQLLEKIDGAILLGDLGDQHTIIKASLFKWLGTRRIYLIKMLIVEFLLHLGSISIYGSINA
jgi:hypothetical protein